MAQHHERRATVWPWNAMQFIAGGVVTTGIPAGIGLALSRIPITPSLFSAFPMFILTIGVVQAVYVVPVHAYVRRRGDGAWFLRGLWCGAAMVFLGDAALVGLALSLPVLK